MVSQAHGLRSEKVKQTSDLHHQWRSALNELGFDTGSHTTAAIPMRQYA